MKRTTVFIDDDLLLESQQFAASTGSTFTAILNDALRAYVEARRSSRSFTFIGLGNGDADGLDDEQSLSQGVNPIEGRSPHRSGK